MNYINDVLLNNKVNKNKGLYSVCTANPFVLESSISFAKENDSVLLVEATSNQVNQFGGYTGMKPEDYMSFVAEIADRIGYDKSNLILGGDHLGPNPFQKEEENIAMPKAIKMVYDYVKAGFKKIHLDCSMRLADDSRDVKLSDEIIAYRTIELVKASKKAFLELQAENEDEVHPIYVVGSEVPIPGGAQEIHDTLEVTTVEDFESTMAAMEKAFVENNLEDEFRYVIACVVQPGVEFSDEKIDEYNRENAKELTNALQNHQNIVLEGHSTDYQTKENLQKMVEDGIKILKVGPQLTYALREALFALESIEKELVERDKQSNFASVLIKEMKKNPANYENHYHDNIVFKMKYSLLDRCRYYLGLSDVDNAINTLISNLEEHTIDDTLLSQFLPKQYRQYRHGLITKKPNDLIDSKIKEVLADYQFATNQ